MGRKTIPILPEAEIGHVPCDGCTACCHGDAVRVPAARRREPLGRPSLIPISRGPACWLTSRTATASTLGRSGCTIHDRKPQVCGEMDCRLIFLRIPFDELRRMHATGRLRMDVWRRGQELMKARP